MKTIFGDINVLSVWVYFKSDAYLILWHHLLTSEIPVAVLPQSNAHIIQKYLFLHSEDVTPSETIQCVIECQHGLEQNSPTTEIIASWQIYAEILKCFLLSGT